MSTFWVAISLILSTYKKDYEKKFVNSKFADTDRQTDK